VSFAHLWVLWLLPLSLLIGAIALGGDLARRRAQAKLGEAKLLGALVTFDAGPRRTLKGILRVLAVALAIVAVAQPRPRDAKGERVVPAADVSVMLVLDLSKSMYATDVLPSRIERARSDITRMIHELPTVRWGAVAFAGEAIAFPPTTDGPQAAQFLAAYQPYEMPGGTAIAKALELARRNLVPHADAEPGETKEPATKNGRKRLVVVLVTDGEDLEGDPAAVANEAAKDGIVIDVVAVGGRSPQPIPDFDPDSGVAHGFIRTDDGRAVTTELTPTAEEQMRSIAAETKGRYVRTEDGTTGLLQIENDLKAMIAREGVTHTRTIYAEQYAVPLGLAALLLVIDAFIPESKSRSGSPPRPGPSRESKPERASPLRRRRSEVRDAT
jgi:Ca-activated chloride channel family protein